MFLKVSRHYAWCLAFTASIEFIASLCYLYFFLRFSFFCSVWFLIPYVRDHDSSHFRRISYSETINQQTNRQFNRANLPTHLSTHRRVETVYQGSIFLAFVFLSGGSHARFAPKSIHPSIHPSQPPLKNNLNLVHGHGRFTNRSNSIGNTSPFHNCTGVVGAPAPQKR